MSLTSAAEYGSPLSRGRLPAISDSPRNDGKWSSRAPPLRAKSPPENPQEDETQGMAIYEFEGQAPQFPQAHYFVADTAVLIGNVSIEKDVNIWFGAVLRG